MIRSTSIRPTAPKTPYFQLRLGHVEHFIHPGRGQLPVFIPAATFDFNRDALIKHSRSFAKHLRDPEKNDEELDILGDEDVPAYTVFHFFVRENRIREADGTKFEWNTAEDLVEAYLLGERIGASRFMDHIMDELLRKLKPHAPPGQALVNAVWRLAKPNSLLRKLFVEVCGSGNVDCCRIENSDDYPNSFLRRVQQCYLELGKDRQATGIPRFGNLPTKVAELGSCWYHDHAVRGLECYREVTHVAEQVANSKRKRSPLAEEVDAGAEEPKARKQKRKHPLAQEYRPEVEEAQVQKRQRFVKAKPKGRLGIRTRLSAIHKVSNDDGLLLAARRVAPARVTHEDVASDDDKENEPLPPPSDQVEQVGDGPNVHEPLASISALEGEQAGIGEDDRVEKESQGHSDSTVSMVGSHSGVDLKDSIVVVKERRLGHGYPDE
ncbi:uncharacterized protein BDZ99DRAFT_286473 [Mytilinidion resinicola]|uniref:BTB domain-containing protein n=1 Tax=Mytilinidion resinicola TaxID=574789 RepID=A0A6A6YRQ4_9PEZI|nr:uncharacterized protein BDZ99DRAFT_286473 [Mytilinidion resinicola]KAF2810645.1 hypothetical protein BDZ99DRAFT_286473 [Mytilinidion resinicola]